MSKEWRFHRKLGFLCQAVKIWDQFLLWPRKMVILYPQKKREKDKWASSWDYDTYHIGDHARLKNEFTEDKKYHNLMRWLKCFMQSEEFILHRAWQSQVANLCASVVQSVGEIEPRHEKTCLQGFWPNMTQTGLLSWWDWLRSWNFGYSK